MAEPGPYGGLMDLGASNAAYADQILAMQQAMQGGGGGGGGRQYVSGGDSGVDLNLMRNVNNENFRAAREQANYMAGLQNERDDRQQAREMQMLQTKDQMEMGRMDKQQQLGQDMLKYQLESMTQLELKKKELEFQAAQVSEEARGPLLQQIDDLEQQITDGQLKLMKVQSRTEGMSKDTQAAIAKQASEMEQRLASQQKVVETYGAAAKSTLPGFFKSKLESSTSGLGGGRSLFQKGIVGPTYGLLESIGEIVTGDRNADTRNIQAVTAKGLGGGGGGFSTEALAAAAEANPEIKTYLMTALGGLFDEGSITPGMAHGFTNKTITEALTQTLANGNLAFDQTAAAPAINELVSSLQMIKALPNNTDATKYGNMVRNALKEASMAIYGKAGYEGQLSDVLDATLGEIQGMRADYATKMGEYRGAITPESMAQAALLGVTNNASDLRFALNSATAGQVHTLKSLDKALGVLKGAKEGTTYQLSPLGDIRGMLTPDVAGRIDETTAAMKDLVAQTAAESERRLGLERQKKKLDTLGASAAKKAENQAMLEMLRRRVR